MTGTLHNDLLTFMIAWVSDVTIAAFATKLISMSLLAIVLLTELVGSQQ